MVLELDNKKTINSDKIILMGNLAVLLSYFFANKLIVR